MGLYRRRPQRILPRRKPVFTHTAVLAAGRVRRQRRLAVLAARTTEQVVEIRFTTTSPRTGRLLLSPRRRTPPFSKSATPRRPHRYLGGVTAPVSNPHRWLAPARPQPLVTPSTRPTPRRNRTLTASTTVLGSTSRGVVLPTSKRYRVLPPAHRRVVFTFEQPVIPVNSFRRDNRRPKFNRAPTDYLLLSSFALSAPRTGRLWIPPVRPKFIPTRKPLHTAVRSRHLGGEAAPVTPVPHKWLFRPRVRQLPTTDFFPAPRRNRVLTAFPLVVGSSSRAVSTVVPLRGQRPHPRHRLVHTVTAVPVPSKYLKRNRPTPTPTSGSGSKAEQHRRTWLGVAAAVTGKQLLKRLTHYFASFPTTSTGSRRSRLIPITAPARFVLPARRRISAVTPNTTPLPPLRQRFPWLGVGAPPGVAHPARRRSLFLPRPFLPSRRIRRRLVRSGNTTDFLNGLWAYYRLDGNLRDSSGNNRHLTTDLGATYQTAKLNQGLATEGGSTTTVPTGTLATHSYSISVWMHATHTGGPASGATVGWDRFYLRQTEVGGTLHAVNFTGEGMSGLLPGWFITSHQWNHIVVTWNHSTQRRKIYVNGVLVSNNSESSPGTSAFTQTFADATTSYSSGLDEVGLWTRALNPLEVETLYNDGDGFDPTPIDGRVIALLWSLGQFDLGWSPDDHDLLWRNPSRSLIWTDSE